MCPDRLRFLSRQLKICPDSPKCVQTLQDVSGQFKICPDSSKCVCTVQNMVSNIWQYRMPETLELWTFCALAQPWLWRRWRQNVVPIPRQRHRSDFVPRGRPALQWLQHQLFLSSSFSHAPPPSFSRDDKPGDKELQKCQKLRHPFFRNCVTLLQNCIIHHISVKNVLFIQHHMTRIGLMRNSSTWSPFKL